ncbi:MAG: hypothetical protein WBH35_00370 [Bacillota bacterium]|nr:hypothetical protein [Bacillota bacterium]HOB90813.1 hypothetical protein [Bacillota bacterium]HPZ54006.1 hypothetical protein [Bacillota bacterium]HQD17477.1 hypothetical protein [Bacillota bacterium]
MLWFVVPMIIMAAAQGRRLYLDRMFKELAAFAAVWIVAVIYGIVTLSGIRIPKPIEIIAALFERVF